MQDAAQTTDNAEGTIMIYIAIWLTLASAWLGSWIWAWAMEARDKKALAAQAIPVAEPKEIAAKPERPVAAAA